MFVIMQHSPQARRPKRPTPLHRDGRTEIFTSLLDAETRATVLNTQDDNTVNPHLPPVHYWPVEES